jgi:hypothetical protein
LTREEKKEGKKEVPKIFWQIGLSQSSPKQKVKQ